MMNNRLEQIDNLLEPQDWSFPIPIAYGPGRLSEISKHCKKMGIEHPLIVTDKGSAHLPFIELLQDFLSRANISSALFGEISPNPLEKDILAGRKKFHNGKHDAVIAIGGGSAMDGGKCICLTANNDYSVWDFEFEQQVPKIQRNQPFPTLITIPTTAGTGAETESTAMVTDVDKGMKFCVWHPDLKPSLALLDPELTLDLPPTLTAWTGTDAMVHAIEAFLVPGFHPLCDGAALEGLRLVSKWLPTAVHEPNNLAARGGMLVGSCLAGIAFLKGLGMVHAISHMIGAEFDTQHGLTNAIILPVVLRFNLPGLESQVTRMAKVMNLADDSIDSFIAEIENMLNDINIPKSLKDINVPSECAQRIAEKAILDSAAGTNPRQASIEEIKILVETAIERAR